MRGPIAVVFGTRPEIVKLAGVVNGLGEAAILVHTGQHWDDSMAGVFLRDMGVGRPHHNLGIGGLSRGAQIGDALTRLGALFDAVRPAAVVVQGDTNSTLAGGLAANACGTLLVHVEAGLRSYDRAMPEEHNRVLVDHLADLCCAPTDVSAANLRREGVADERIVVTGNTVIEAVRRLLPDAPARARLLDSHGLRRDEFVLATIHRPENTDGPSLDRVLAELARLSLPVVLPIHPRTATAAERRGLAPLLARLRTVPPLPYESFLALLAECAVCVSDSGGIQEEVTVVGRPVVVVRRSTERPEVLGRWATLVPPGSDLLAAVSPLLVDVPALHERLSAAPTPYGDGRASERIVALIGDLIERSGGATVSRPSAG